MLPVAVHGARAVFYAIMLLVSTTFLIGKVRVLSSNVNKHIVKTNKSKKYSAAAAAM